jgi:hypothetical protein
MPSTGLPGPQDVQKFKNTCQSTVRYPQQVLNKLAEAYLCSSDTATCSCESSRHFSPAFLVPRYGTGRKLHPACNMAECFLALLSSFSNDSARSTVSPYPRSISDFCRDLSTTSCTRQHSLLSTQFLWKLTTHGYCCVPSSTVQPGALTPSSGPPSSGR